MNAELERLLLLKGRDRLPRVLIAAAECAPLSKTGGLADVAGALPKALDGLGIDARVITPYHRCIKEKYAERAEKLCEFYIELGWRHQYVGLYRLRLAGLTVYLIDNEFYFGGPIYKGGTEEGEQYAFFQRAVLEALPRLDFAPDVLHCNDWHTAMLPFLIKTQYQGRPQGGLKTVLTIHNLAFQGKYDFDFVCDVLGVERRWCTPDGIGHFGCANFLKAGCLFADRVNTVSPSYADEIRTPAFGEGLQDVLLWRGGDVSGILNGLDTEVFDPASDPNIAVNYDADTPERRQENKLALLRELGLDKAGADTPLIAMVTRMTAQKGFDIVLQALDELMARDAAFVLLGTGDARYEDAMRGFEQRYRGRLCAYLSYDEALSRRIYAGADFLLMPSAFEPCGLSQLIAMRYGALPIVHAVGGLRDTVALYDRESGEGAGFPFGDYSCGALLGAAAYALSVYQDKAAMDRLIRRDMARDFSFDSSALAYAGLYVTVLDYLQPRLRHDPARERFRSPFGAVKCGETVTLRLEAYEGVQTAELLLGGEALPMQRGDGGFSVCFTAPETPAALRYSFRLAPGVFFGADGLGSSPMRPWQLTVYDPAFAVPAWAEGTVIYQIFPDRFAPGGGAFAVGADYHRGLGRSIEVHESWDEPVKYQSADGADYVPNDFYGGTLRGILAQLPAFREMGVGCLYLNPVFESDSNHRYNTADYDKIDPMLGTREDFEALCAAAHALGMRVVLDGVFSHTGDDSIYFNKYGRYPGVGAYQGEESDYFRWYDFRAFPDDYRAWWGFRSLPEVDETDPRWQRFMVSGGDSILKKWLRRGADGWRLDVADELPDAVIGLMRDSAKAEKSDALIIGEVWEDATNKVSYGAQRSYALGRGLDSVMNYPLRTKLIDFALGRCDAFALRDFLLEQKMNYPAPMYRCLMNLLGSHDTARLRTVLGCGMDGSGLKRAQQAEFSLSSEQDARGAALQRLCAAVQFALPGMPAVYYGDEEGMQGFRDPFCRAPYCRGKSGLRGWYAHLAQQRRSVFPLSHGDAAFAAADGDVLCILRWVGGEACMAVISRAAEDRSFRPEKTDFAGLSEADAAALPPIPAFTAAAMDAALIQL